MIPRECVNLPVVSFALAPYRFSRVEVDGSVLYEAWIDGKRVAECRVTLPRPGAWDVHTASRESLSAPLYHSLIEISLLWIETQRIVSDDWVTTPDIGYDLSEAGFNLKGDRFERRTDGAWCLRMARVKREILTHVDRKKPVGQGYLVDCSTISDRDALEGLNDRYNLLAWGPASWAWHGDVAADEKRVIERFAKGNRVLEIGAGSGRVTKTLATTFSGLWATDRVEGVIKNLRKDPDLAYCQLVTDDIRGSRLADASFDLIVWWENGLGGLLQRSDRVRALREVGRLLAPDGRAILGLRNLVTESADHFMPSKRCDDVFGIYHTFSRDEVALSLPDGLTEVDRLEGDSRPAGGTAFFSILHKPRGQDHHR